MALADEVANAVARVAAPIVGNAVATLAKEIRDGKDDILERLSGKVIDVKITLPDLTK